MEFGHCSYSTFGSTRYRTAELMSIVLQYTVIVKKKKKQFFLKQIDMKVKNIYNDSLQIANSKMRHAGI